MKNKSYNKNDKEIESQETVVKAEDLPMSIVLELANGLRKTYSLHYAKKAEGLILNKAI